MEVNGQVNTPAGFLCKSKYSIRLEHNARQTMQV